MTMYDWMPGIFAVSKDTMQSGLFLGVTEHLAAAIYSNIKSGVSPNMHLDK